MATYKSINQATNIVSVGRTAPVPRGQQTSEKSLPVVLASDAPAIPVAEQNKVASEVALSLLGIPRAEVALGIFADVNTYDVNPSEWSIDPVDKRTFVGPSEASGIRPYIYEGYNNNEYNWGLTHVPEEAGAMIEAPPGETAVLTSKRFFRYQPGRVSAATFGVKSSGDNVANPDKTNRNPSIKKYGIYDKFDGYYWETRDTGRGDQFGVTRRTQSIIDFRFSHKEFTTNSTQPGNQITDYGITGKGKESGEVTESIMNSPIAYSVNDTIIIPNVYSGSSLRDRHFKDNNIPQIGMTIRNITVSTSDCPNVYGEANIQDDVDASPLFRESTVVTNVEIINGTDLKISLNNPPIVGEVWKVDGTAANPSGATDTSAASVDNGRTEGTFGRGQGGYADGVDTHKRNKRLKFTFAGDNLIVRDNLPLIKAAIYDPSMMKTRTEYKISSVAENGTITFLRPKSAAGFTTANDWQRKGAINYDDSPLGLYVQNVFNTGQLVEYTTDATTFTDGADSSLLVSGAKNVFFIEKVDAGNNSIKLRHIPHRGTSNIIYGGENSPKFVSFSSDLTYANASALAAINAGTTNTQHFIKTPVPFLFPEVEYVDTANDFNVADVMFPYTRNFTVFNSLNTSSGQTALTGTGHTGKKEVGLLNTDLSNNIGDLDAGKAEEYKAVINDINSGLACSAMNGGRTHQLANATSSEPSRGTEVRKEVHRKSAGWRYWIDDNVNPEFWGVYEYKIPRSRFSFDSLNAENNESIFYSDTVKDGGKVRYPGQETIATENTRNSVWDIDFANVIMKKIEFSWYGAVGALFLAYVPSGTGEARWVRVHHLRCSNQLKTASLGNATLPLTYTVYGGGMPKQYGNSSLRTTNYSSGKSVSEFITKYGSSYYIDGGDRGTVRLFNYAQPAVSRVSTSKFGDEELYGYATLPFTSNTFMIKNKPTKTGREDMYFGASVKFGTSDSTARVVHVERKGTQDGGSNNYSPNGHITITLDRAMSINNPITFFVEPPYTVFGISSKTNIQSSQDFLVRNRVQVYPTKLSVGMQTTGGQKATTTMSLTKNVKFAEDIIFSIYDSDESKKYKTIKFTGTDTSLTLAGSGLPTRLTYANTSPNRVSNTSPAIPSAALGGISEGPYYANAKVGDKLYGWARVTDGITPFTLFGRCEVVGIGNAGNNCPIWDFISEDSYTGTARFVEGSLFTHAYQYFNDLGANNLGPSTSLSRGRLGSALSFKDEKEIERLSSIKVQNEIRRPIPGTGSKVATLFLEDGSDYFDLQPYFDYNKDYISFPLTNIPDNLFIGAQINSDLSPVGNPAPTGNSASPRVAVSLTWEEQ